MRGSEYKHVLEGPARRSCFLVRDTLYKLLETTIVVLEWNAQTIHRLAANSLIFGKADPTEKDFNAETDAANHAEEPSEKGPDLENGDRIPFVYAKETCGGVLDHVGGCHRLP